jgi:hypothetical protein
LPSTAFSRISFTASNRFTAAPRLALRDRRTG